jgi:hypothetical protein
MMRLITLLSIVFALLGMSGTYLVSHNLPHALLFMAVITALGAGYDLWSAQYGFVLSSAIGAYLYWRGWGRRK